MRCNLDSQRAAQKRKTCDESQKITTPMHKRLRTDAPVQENNTCFICPDPILPSQKYSKASTMNIDNNVRVMATELNDTVLLAKLSEGDMHALDAVYHKECMVQDN